jgi:hypothetical protein
MIPALRAPHVLTCASLVLSLATAGIAAADTVRLVPLKDNTLIETPVGNSNGAGDGIFAGKVGLTGGGTRRRGLLAFDLGSIPAGATIDAVRCSLTMAQSPSATPYTITLHRVGADWGEAGSFGSGQGGPAFPGDATWIHSFYNTTAWTSPGGDFSQIASAGQLVGSVGTYAWTGAGLVADVQSWLDQPATNFGWLVMGDEEFQSSVKKFYSREGFIPPTLTVDYTPSSVGVGPEPGDRAVWFAPPWPVPTSGPVNLGYSLPRGARVSVSILDVSGRLVRRLATGIQATAGRHTLAWDGRRESGETAAAGVYLAQLVVDGRQFQRRISLLR